MQVSSIDSRLIREGDSLLDPLALAPGRVTGLFGPPGFGLTRIGMSLLAGPAQSGTVALLDVRGWLNPAAAWEAGIAPDRLVVIKAERPLEWSRVAALLVEGVKALYAEVPDGTRDQVLRKLVALARRRGTPVLLRPLNERLPSGIAHLRLEPQEISWQGTEAGHGRLAHRRLVMRASGKAVGGMATTFEVEDDGADTVRVVPGLATEETRRVAG